MTPPGQFLAEPSPGIDVYLLVMDLSQFSSSAFGPQASFGSTVKGYGERNLPASHPWILDTLFRNFDFDLEQVADIIDPILTVQNHCQCTALYIQGVAVQAKAFVTTNLNLQQTIQVTLCGTSWCLGSSPHCTIWIPVQDISPRHAVLMFKPQQGFFLVDLESEQGTRVNRQRLRPAQPYPLVEGDLIELGGLGFEFFTDSVDTAYPVAE